MDHGKLGTKRSVLTAGQGGLREVPACPCAPLDGPFSIGPGASDGSGLVLGDAHQTAARRQQSLWESRYLGLDHGVTQ